MNKLCIITAALFFLEPAVSFANGPMPEAGPADAPVHMQGHGPRFGGPQGPGHASPQKCPWDELDMRSRAQVWSKLSARHRDYHWRMMTNEERSELRKYLSLEEKKALRERFVMQLHPSEQPYVLYKRLSRQELQELRQQVREAQKQQLFANMLKTPAQIEYENQFLSSQAKIHDQTHQMLIITIQDNGPELSNLGQLPGLVPQPQSPEAVPDNAPKP